MINSEKFVMPSNDEQLIPSSCYHQKRQLTEDGHYRRQGIAANRPADELHGQNDERVDGEGEDEERGNRSGLFGRPSPEPDCHRQPINAVVPFTCCGQIARCLINMKCTDGALVVISFLLGLAAILLQLASLFSDHWLYTMEPRTVGNCSEKNGDPKDYLFRYNSGYWRICRELYMPSRENLTSAENNFISTEPEFRYVCLNWNNPPNGSEDHLGFSKASGAILNRILRSAILQIVSLAITIVGLSLSLPGYIRRDKRTFVAAILYIISGIFVSISVMEYIRVVDDEMAPKMKQTPEGNSSKYRADYGWSYISASMSFLCIEACALIELLLFLRRFPSLEDKMELVPGLKDKIRRAVLHHEFDEILPARTCSRSSPRISFSYAPDTLNEVALSDSL